MTTEVFRINIEGFKPAIDELSQLEVSLKKVTAERNALLKKQKDGESLTKEEAATLQRVTSEQARLSQEKRKAKTVVETEVKLNRVNIGAYERLSAQLNKARARYKDLAAQNKGNTKEAKTLLKEITKLDSKLKQIDNSVGQNQRSVGKYTNALKGAGMQIMGALGLTAGIAGLVNVFKSAFNTMKGFEEAMAKVASISGATSDELRKLTDDAKRLGAATRFTASDVAALQLEFSKLGFSTSEILATTEATLQLATATGEGLAKSAEVAGATLRGFGMDARETGVIVDVMAKSFSSSALNLERFQESMKYVAPVAASLKIPVEKVTAQLSALADAGIHGSMAGTALRQIYIEMAKTGLSADEAFAKLTRTGLTLADANDEVGQRAMTALLILSKQQEKVDDLTVSYENATGSAKEMADVMENTTAGSFRSLASAWEGFILSLGRTDGWAKDVVDSWIWMVRGITEAMMSEEEKMQRERDRQTASLLSDTLLPKVNKLKQGFIDAGMEASEAEIKAYEELISTTLEKIDEGQKKLEGFEENRYRLDENGNALYNLKEMYKLQEDIALGLKGIELLETELNEKKAVQEKKNLELQIEKKKEQEKLAKLKKQELELQEKITAEINKSIEAAQKFIEEQEKSITADIDVETDSEAAALETKLQRERDLVKQTQDWISQYKNETVFQQIDEERRALENARQNNRISEEQYIEASKALTKEEVGYKIGAAMQLADVIQSGLREGSIAQRAIASAMTAVNTYQAIMKTYATLGYPWGIPAAAAVGLQGALQVAKINNVKFAKGGVIGGSLHSQGGTQFVGSDGSAFEAERGELLAIVNRRDTAELQALSKINSKHGRPFFAAGGTFTPQAGNNASQIAELSAMLKNQRVYVLENDITTTQRKVQVTNERADI